MIAALGIAAAPASAADARTPTPKVDADRDRVFDDLERSLAGDPLDEKVKVIVSLNAPATAGRVDGLERRVGNLAVRKRFRFVDAFAAEVTKRQVQELAERPDVAAVEADSRVRALDRTGQDAFGVTHARIHSSSLDGDRDGRRLRYSRRDMVAAVVDTGIHARHRDLDAGKVLAFVDCRSGICRARSPFDDNGHGTHMASTLAGSGDARPDRLYRGVAPYAALVGVKVLGADGSASKSAVVAGIDWVIANRSRYGIEAVNLSLGGTGCSDGTDSMSRAANRANSAGLVTVAAAGNRGPETCTINSPAAASGALAVGAMFDLARGGFLASWISARGMPGGRIKPDVMAPGERVIAARHATRSGYWAKNGTSTAAPFVTGVALLMRDANPALSTASVKGRIRSTALDWGLGGSGRTPGSRGPDIDFGWGRLDAYAALRAAGGRGLSRPPAMPGHQVLEGSFSAPLETPRTFPVEVRDRCHPIAASLIIPGYNARLPQATDFDIVLRNPSGAVVATGDSIERQDDVMHRPAATGTYTVEVRAYSGAGSFFVDVSAGLTDPPSGAPATCRA